MSARREAESWAAAVQALAEARGLRYEQVGGINAVGAPLALCPGGTNRLTGELAEGFWGASCDADEVERGGLFSKALLPRAVLCKSHMPDLAAVVPDFSVEAVEGNAEDLLLKRARNRVQFESIEFNRRYIATVPTDADPVPVRELFSPSLLDSLARIEGSCDCGLNEGQLFFLWRLRELNEAELETAIDAAARIFKRIHAELAESGAGAFQPGPWNAGLEPFPAVTI